MQPVSEPRSACGGFTLVELVMTMVIISIAAIAIFSSLSYGLKHQSDGLWQTRAAALAEGYSEQILARRFDENTPPGGVPPCQPMTCTPAGSFDDGETRAQYDDVDDYDGVDDSPPLDEQGAALPGFDGYRVQVSVAYANAGQVAALGLSDATDAKLITVNVTPPAGTPIAFHVLKANF